MPPLVLEPKVVEQLVYLSKKNNVEVGGYGLSPEDEPLHITKLFMPKQTVSMASIDFPDEGLIDFTSTMQGRGLHIDRYLRVWIHTHPGNSTNPSGTDVKHFEQLVEDQRGMLDLTLAAGGPHIKCWAIMAIIGMDSSVEAYIGGFLHDEFAYIKIKAEVDHPASPYHDEWDALYDRVVSREVHASLSKFPLAGGQGGFHGHYGGRTDGPAANKHQTGAIVQGTVLSDQQEKDYLNRLKKNQNQKAKKKKGKNKKKGGLTVVKDDDTVHAYDNITDEQWAELMGR